jgi:hypothetical protein
MDAGRLTAAVAGGAAIAIVMLYTVAAIRRRQALDDAAEPQGDLLRAGHARFRITFADGTVAEVEADEWRTGNNLDDVVLLHHVIDLTGSHEQVVASYHHVKEVQRIDS